MPYPTLCKGRFRAGEVTAHIFEDPASLDASELIPQLADAGVTALKIEGRQRSRSYTDAVVRAFRAAVDAHARGADDRRRHALVPERRRQHHPRRLPEDVALRNVRFSL